MGIPALNEEPENSRYQRLVNIHGVESKAELKEGSRGRGLFATCDIKEGEVALRVPESICLFHELTEENIPKAPGDKDEAEDLHRNRVTWASEMWLTKEFMKMLSVAAAVCRQSLFFLFPSIFLVRKLDQKNLTWKDGMVNVAYDQRSAAFELRMLYK
jgi:hypothetical protein